MAKGNLILQVKFEKVGNRIKYTLPVKMYCERMQTEIPNSATLDVTDCLFGVWLGASPERLFKKSHTIFRKVNLNQIYSHCDVPKSK